MFSVETRIFFRFRGNYLVSSFFVTHEKRTVPKVHDHRESKHISSKKVSILIITDENGYIFKDKDEKKYVIFSNSPFKVNGK